MKYQDMTDEEYDALDEELTRNTPKIICDGNDWLSQRERRLAAQSQWSHTVPQFANESVSQRLVGAM